MDCIGMSAILALKKLFVKYDKIVIFGEIEAKKN